MSETQCAAVRTTVGAINAPVQYWVGVLICTTPGTVPAAPPAMAVCSTGVADAVAASVAGIRAPAVRKLRSSRFILLFSVMQCRSRLVRRRG